MHGFVNSALTEESAQKYNKLNCWLQQTGLWVAEMPWRTDTVVGVCAPRTDLGRNGREERTRRNKSPCLSPPHDLVTVHPFIFYPPFLLPIQIPLHALITDIKIRKWEQA